MQRRHINRWLLASSLPLVPGIAPAQRRAAHPPLVIWFTVQGSKALRRIGERFTADTGVPVIVETPDEGPAKFQKAAAAGKGPDIYVYAHDRLGEWTAAGLLREVHPGHELRSDILEMAWRGFTLRGRTWGYPYAVEAVTLVHNRRLVPEAPASWTELMALDDRLAREGRRAILWDYTNTYFTWPLLAAHGAYAFARRPDGSWDTRDTGVTHPGALKGAQLLDQLLREGRMPRGSGYPDMESAMAGGGVAMMINGPWSWVNLKRVGMDFGVARIPALDGKAASPMVGIKGVMINRHCPHAEVATEFIERYMLSPEGLALIDQAEPIGAPASQRVMARLGQDPRIAGIMASAQDGQITPSVPEMGRFWSAMKTALTNLSEARQGPQEALQAAARRIVPS
jgi:maltose/maltodextrin transport system substrate-binding protein